jgi:hypothetical protein
MHLTNHHAEVAAFGGMFLLLVFLNFLLDDEKEHHWLGHFEEKLGSLGKVSSISVMIAIGALMASLSLVTEGQKMVVLMSGLWGILIYVGVDVLSATCWRSRKRAAARSATWSSAAVSAASCTWKCWMHRSASTA